MDDQVALLRDAVETCQWLHAWMVREAIQRGTLEERVLDALDLADRRLARRLRRIEASWPEPMVDVQVTVGIIVSSLILAIVVVALRWFPDEVRAVLIGK